VRCPTGVARASVPANAGSPVFVQRRGSLRVVGVNVLCGGAKGSVDVIGKWRCSC